MSKTKSYVEDSRLTTPSKLRWSNVIAQSTLRGGHVHCVREKAIRSFTLTCTHGGGNDCKRHVKSILLSLNVHNHVDYSGTFGGVCKVHISALVTSPKNWVVALSFFLCLSLSLKKKKKKKEVEEERTNLLTGQWEARDTKVSSRCFYCINGEWVPVATKIMNLLKKSQPPCLKLLEAKWGEGQQDIIRAEAMKCDLLVVKTCNHHSPWIYWCF